MNQYIEISPDFNAAMQGCKAGNVLFASTATNDGRIVTAAQSAIDFPAEFETITYTIIELSETDFPNNNTGPAQ